MSAQTPPVVASTADRFTLTLGATRYRFRAPTAYDPAEIRRTLALRRVRRPSLTEFRVAALAGIGRMAEIAGDGAEGERQQAVVEEYYRLLDPVSEDDIDIPDPLERGEELLRQEQARHDRLRELIPDVLAIEANLERHAPAYAELLADRNFWDDVSRIEVVRLLLMEIDGEPVPREDGGAGPMTEQAFGAIPSADRLPLATFAFRLLGPDEAQRKN